MESRWHLNLTSKKLTTRSTGISWSHDASYAFSTLLCLFSYGLRLYCLFPCTGEWILSRLIFLHEAYIRETLSLLLFSDLHWRFFYSYSPSPITGFMARYPSGRHVLKLSHLFFAGDSLIFLKASIPTTKNDQTCTPTFWSITWSTSESPKVDSLLSSKIISRLASSPPFHTRHTSSCSCCRNLSRTLLHHR